jgi:hypothetical protein
MTDDELRSLFDAMRQENVAAHAETRHFFELTAEAMRHEIGLIAEKVTSVDEKLDRTTFRLEARIASTAAETQAMIKFSHSELDRRVTSLESARRTVEETLADVQTRLERLESSTH